MEQRSICDGDPPEMFSQHSLPKSYEKRHFFVTIWISISVKAAKKLFECFKKLTIEEEVARLVAESNFSFNQKSKTRFIRELLKKRYPDSTVPKFNKAAAALMMKYVEHAENGAKQRIQKLKFDKKFPLRSMSGRAQLTADS